MDRVATTIRMDRATRDLLDVISKAKGVAVNVLVNRAISDLVDNEAMAIENELSDTLERLRSYRSKNRFPSAAIRAAVADEMSHPDPAEADSIFVIDPHGVESSVLAILNREA